MATRFLSSMLPMRARSNSCMLLAPLASWRFNGLGSAASSKKEWPVRSALLGGPFGRLVELQDRLGDVHPGFDCLLSSDSGPAGVAAGEKQAADGRLDRRLLRTALAH